MRNLIKVGDRYEKTRRQSSRKKKPRKRSRDWKKYNRFRKDEYGLILPIIAQVVYSVDAPYKVKEPEKKHERCMAVDETKTKIHGRQVFIWTARDVDEKEILGVRVSYTRQNCSKSLI